MWVWVCISVYTRVCDSAGECAGDCARFQVIMSIVCACLRVVL
jgi:hypothetical protein